MESQFNNANQAKMEFGFSPAKFLAAQKDFSELFRMDRFGFPNVFMDSNAVVEKYHQYFHTIPNLKIIGLALPETYMEDFFEHYDLRSVKPFRPNGVSLKLNQEEEADKDNTSMGFDLLCFTGADYCSFLCSQLENKMHDQYGVQYNEYGLISDFETVERILSSY